MSKIDKARFWTAVLYQENMRADWQEEIGDIVQMPYAYCCHTQDKDSKSEHRKDHVHVILAFPNTTTYKHAMNVFNLLSAEGKKALNKCEAVVGIRNVYDYLIHDTEDCRKKGKELYDPSERITGNNFDIGAYEQISTAEKNEIFIELGEAIRKNGFTNYMDFYEWVIDNCETMAYVEVMRGHSGHFERLTRGNYLRWEQRQKGVEACPSQARVPDRVPKNTEKNTKNTEKNTDEGPICCPECGSIAVIKKGKTLANTQRFACKDCGKTFI